MESLYQPSASDPSVLVMLSQGNLRLFGTMALFVLAVPMACALAQGPEGEVAVDFQRDIWPLLESRCLDCHGPESREGGLSLTSRRAALVLGDSGKPGIVPGNPDGSELIRRMKSDDIQERMPLDDDPLAPEEIALLARWVRLGAEWPDENVENKHWAYVAPARPELPEISDTIWPSVPIDYFVFARLQREGLAPSPPADRARLIRRVYLDLIGLPPSVDEVDAFIADHSADAYERVVDRLLASPRYGEKWARQWLDLARYSDSNGYQADQLRENWAYRDWVIRAMNDDMPFDQFTIEQIAGDLLPKSTLDQRIATGFHRLTTCNVEAGVDPEENRVNQVADRVNTSATVWLAATMECAQCHNHKYDPFTQKDYYQLFAYFNNTPLEVDNGGGDGVSYDFVGPRMELPLDTDRAAQKHELQDDYDRLKETTDKQESDLLSGMTAWEATLASARGKPAETHVLEVAAFDSSGGSSHEILEDGSVLVSGRQPDTDAYTVTVDTDLVGITGFKLETLTDPSLPGGGPGRGDVPNIILNEFTVHSLPKGGQSSQPGTVPLHSPTADYSQKNWDVAGAIDGDPKTGWAIGREFGKPHHAVFRTLEPIGREGGTTLVFKLDQRFGRTRTIGRLRLSAITGDPTPGFAEGIAEILAKSGGRTEEETAKLAEFYLNLHPGIRRMRAQAAGLKKAIDAIKPPSTLVMVEMDQPRETHILIRGNFLTPGAKVEPGVPDALHPLPQNAPKDRRALAKWLVDPENPLVARVTVNRWWAALFGRGLVPTAEDFGSKSDGPSHPQLLDWLAARFVESGWSMKHIHKLIVMSATYQQSSRVTPALWERDPDNVLLARGPRFRLAAEVIRDNALAISGLLSTKMGGPPVYPPQPPGLWHQTGRNEPVYAADTDEDRFRRGIYVVWRRAAPYPSFVNFDAPDRMACVVQRSRTNTPIQALTLLNDEAYVELAKAFAARVLTDRPNKDIRGQLQYAFRLCLARQPKPKELALLEHVYRHELAEFEEDPDSARTLLSGFKLPAGRKTPTDRKLWAAWFCVANILLNLDETITKS
jgi:hypothetical protein